MALNKKQKGIRDRNVKELDEKIAEKQGILDRTIKSHNETLIMLQDGIDERTLLRDALKGLK